MNLLTTEKDLVAVAAALIGSDVSLSTAEAQLVRQSGGYASGKTVEDVRRAILRGGDPLGEAFVTIRSSKSRRYYGATYTPTPVVESMLSWAMTENTPSRIVDPGAGTGRYLVAAANRFPLARLIGVELDPMAALMLRANVAVLGLSPRTTILVEDYRSVRLPMIRGRTLFIGNPPYVRHHDISEKWKEWFAETAAGYGIKVSKLAGLHIHFFVKTMQLGKLGDFGAFITSAEWLDVNYGSALRELLADGLGGCALHVLDPNAMPFTDAMTTGAITCFRVGHRPDSLRVRSLGTLDQLDRLTKGKLIPWSDMAKSKRWSTIIRPGPKPSPGYIELGEVCRVHFTGGEPLLHPQLADMVSDFRTAFPAAEIVVVTNGILLAAQLDALLDAGVSKLSISLNAGSESAYRRMKREFPDLHLHAFSPEEIDFGQRKSGMELPDYFRWLIDAGLGTMPGTAAEILDDSVRQIISPRKLNTARWVEIVKAAHSVGLRSTSTLMYGHIETVEQVAAHLNLLREIQRETGGFTEFVPLGFIHERNILFNHMNARAGASMPEDLRMIAVARLFLRPWISNIQMSWVKMGPKLAQMALLSGANDFGGTLMEESISRESGSHFGENLPAEEIRQLIRAVGRTPVERSTTYQILRRFDDPAEDPPSLEPEQAPELSGPARWRAAAQY